MRQVLGAACLAFVVFAGTGPAAATDEEEQIQAKLQAVQKQKAELRQQEQDLLKQEQDLQTRLTQLRAKEAGAIKAEVTGILRFENGMGAFISVRYTYEPDRENRVYLRYTEDKVSAKNVDALMGKRVVARGALRQLPEGVRTSVPPHAMYMDQPELEAADAK